MTGSRRLFEGRTVVAIGLATLMIASAFSGIKFASEAEAQIPIPDVQSPSVPIRTYVDASVGLPINSTWTSDLAFFDIDKDGLKELFFLGPRINTGGWGNHLYAFKWTGVLGEWTAGALGAWHDVSAEEKTTSIDHYSYGGIAFGDFNNDGRYDCAVGSHGVSRMDVYLQSENGAYVPSSEGLEGREGSQSDAWTVDLGDFNNDGNLDLLVGPFWGRYLSPFAGDGNGAWVRQSSGIPMGTQKVEGHFCDVNNDGNLDIIATLDWQPRCFLGDGKGSWVDSSWGMAVGDLYFGMPITYGDFNHDGFTDIAFCAGVTQTQTPGKWRWGLYAFLGDGKGGWIDSSQGLPYDVAGTATGIYYSESTSQLYTSIKLADMNNDKYDDLVCLAYDGTVTVYYATGDGKWIRAPPLIGGLFAPVAVPGAFVIVGEQGWRLNVGDFDNNGYNDIAAGSGTYIKVWREASTPISLNVTLIHPDGGECFKRGSVQFIKWRSAVPLLSGDTVVKLELSTDGKNTWSTIAENLPNTGIYQWKVPENVDSSNNCYIRITIKDAENEAIDTNDSPFGIDKMIEHTIRPSTFPDLTKDPIYIFGDEGPRGFILGRDPRTNAPIYNPLSSVSAGNGTENDPFIICDLNISAGNKTYGIWIENTTAYFVIRNISISGAPPCGDVPYGAGIYLKNVVNGKIELCNISGNRYGIALYSSSKISIIDTNCSRNFHLQTAPGVTAAPPLSYGICLVNSDNNSIINCSTYQNSYGGIYLINSNNNRIANSSMADGAYAISELEIDVPEIFIGSLCMSGSSNNVIENNTIGGAINGIVMYASDFNEITKNKFTDSASNDVYYIINSIGNRLTHNTMAKGIVVEGNVPEHWSTQEIDATNTVDGKPIYYWKFVNGGTVPSGAGQVFLINCTNVTVEGQQNRAATGVGLFFSSNCTITNNTISDSRRYGIIAYRSNHNAITGNAVSWSRYLRLFMVENVGGIFIKHSNDNTVANNAVDFCFYGIQLEYADGNSITGNTITRCRPMGSGIRLFISGDNILAGNTITSSTYGIFIENSGLPRLLNNTVSNNKLSQTYVGIRIYNRADGNVVANNIITNSSAAICLEVSNNNILSGNNASSDVLGGYKDVGVIGIYLHNSANNMIIGNNVSHNGKPTGAGPTSAGYGIYIYGTSSTMMEVSDTNTIIGNIASYNSVSGIVLNGASNSIVAGNNATHNAQIGIYIFGGFAPSNNITVTGNNASYNQIGIDVGRSTNVTVAGNDIFYNGAGITLSYSSNNVVTGNNVSKNRYGIFVTYSSGNLIYNNYFSHSQNSNYIVLDAIGNIWNITKTNGVENGWGKNIIGGDWWGGNYWSDYGGNNGGDGFGHTPYEIIIRDYYYYEIGREYDYLPLASANQPPVADFTFEPENPTTADTIYLNSTSSDPDGNIVNWTWNLGDGIIKYGERITHRYSTSGTYIVNLTVTDNEEAEGYCEKEITVSEAPIENRPPTCSLSADPISGNAPLEVTFTMNVNDPDGIPSWELDFGDGTAKQAGNGNRTNYQIQHIYASAGTYNANLTATDDKGAKAYSEVAITVAQLPNNPPTISITDPTENQEISGIYVIKGTSSDPDGNETIQKVAVWISGVEYTSGWQEATGTVSWTYDWDTTAVDNGTYTIRARSYDGTDYSTEDTVTVVVRNEKASGGGNIGGTAGNTPPVISRLGTDRMNYVNNTQIVVHVSGEAFDANYASDIQSVTARLLKADGTTVDVSNSEITKTPNNPDDGILIFNFTISLPQGVLGGEYTVTVTVSDEDTQNASVESVVFYVVEQLPSIEITYTGGYNILEFGVFYANRTNVESVNEFKIWNHMDRAREFWFDVSDFVHVTDASKKIPLVGNAVLKIDDDNDGTFDRTMPYNSAVVSLGTIGKDQCMTVKLVILSTPKLLLEGRYATTFGVYEG